MRRQFCHKKQIEAYTDQIVAIVAIVPHPCSQTHADCIDGVRGTRSSSASARERPMR